MTLRSISLIVAFVATAILASGVTAVAMWSNQFHEPQTPLLRDLPGKTWDEGNAAFRQRIVRRVPIGSPEAALLDLLKTVGFSRGWEEAPSPERHADLQWGTMVCNMGAHVTWQVDAADRITQLETRSHEEGCL